MKIGNYDLDRRVLLVAEIGVNHEGDFAVARQLLRQAASAGADAVKFQAYYPKELRFISPQAEPDRFQRAQKNVLSWDQFRVLADDAQKAGVMFLCTYFDVETIEAVADLVPAMKVASGDLTNVELLRNVAKTGKPVMLSTGMSDERKIAQALDVLSYGVPASLVDRVVLLQCTSSYPCPPEQAQLRAIPYLRRQFGLRTGYSDHTTGITACQAAVALGACVIEKHFTDRKTDRTFRDHALSVEPDEFHQLVEAIRNIEMLLGREEKVVQPTEQENLMAMRRSIGVRRAVCIGTRLTPELLVALRPAAGWPADEVDALVGRVLGRPLEAGQLITVEDLLP